MAILQQHNDTNISMDGVLKSIVVPEGNSMIPLLGKHINLIRIDQFFTFSMNSMELPCFMLHVDGNLSCYVKRSNGVLITWLYNQCMVKQGSDLYLNG